MKSIVQEEKQCYVCHTTYNLHLHHILFGKHRKLADEDGLTCYLCIYHHTGSNEAVHNNHKLDLELKKKAQECYERTHSREEWMSRYHKNYLD